MSRTPLHWAAHYNHPAVIRILLKHGASIDRRDEKYKTPLHLAASQGAVEGTRALLELGAGIGDGIIPPARSAAGSGNVDCMKAFIDAGFNPNTRDLSNRTSLHHVLCGLGKNPEVLEYLPTQESAKMAVKAQDRTGKTPLHLAAERIGAEQHIRLLLDHGADMGVKDCEGFMPAHTAAFKGSAECTRALVEAGFDLNTRGRLGRTILHEAVLGRVVPIVESLLGREGAQMVIDAWDFNGNTPLHLATGNSVEADVEVEMVRLLMRHGANIELKNREGNTPAHIVARGGAVESMRAFIDAGFDVRTRGVRSQIILHRAASRSSTDMVRYLLSACFTRNPYGPFFYKPTVREQLGMNSLLESFRRFGRSISKGHVTASSTTGRDGKSTPHPHNLGTVRSGDGPSTKAPPRQKKAGLVINAQDGFGSTPLHWAAWGTEAEVVMRLLVEYGADPKIKDRCRETPVDVFEFFHRH